MLPKIVITSMTHIKHFTTILSNFYLGLLGVPLSSLGNSIPLAATHPLPAETGTLCIGMAPFSFWQTIIRGERNKLLVRGSRDWPSWTLTA